MGANVFFFHKPVIRRLSHHRPPSPSRPAAPRRPVIFCEFQTTRSKKKLEAASAPASSSDAQIQTAIREVYYG